MAYHANRKNPSAGPIKTPPPTSRDFGFGRQSYGANQWAGRSSADPGVTVMSDLAADLKASSDDGQGVLDAVIQRGVAKNDSTDSFQLRKPPAGGLPINRDAGKNPNANNPKVPGTTVGGQGDPVRKPS
jgi:hypothetical protein